MAMLRKMSLGCLGAAAAGAVLTGPAIGQRERAITPTPDRGAESRRAAEKIARAIATNPRHIRRASFSALPPFSSPAAVSTKRLSGFPLHGRSFGILATGDATEADNANSAGDRSGSLGGPSIRGARDVTILRIDLSVPRNVNCLSLRFRFLSEEFPEYVNDEFNDAFIAELGRSDWDASSKTDPTISAPRNFAVDLNRNPIRVNAVGDASVTAHRARGTTYDAATRRLRASTPIKPGRRILYLSIFDQGDREYDSAVFLDKLTLRRAQACQPGAVRD